MHAERAHRQARQQPRAAFVVCREEEGGQVGRVNGAAPAESPPNSRINPGAERWPRVCDGCVRHPLALPQLQGGHAADVRRASTCPPTDFAPEVAAVPQTERRKAPAPCLSVTSACKGDANSDGGGGGLGVVVVVGGLLTLR